MHTENTHAINHTHKHPRSHALTSFKWSQFLTSVSHEKVTIHVTTHSQIHAQMLTRILKDAVELKRNTNVDGVMAARGLLSNPALFYGYEHTPPACVRDYLHQVIVFGANFLRL